MSASDIVSLSRTIASETVEALNQMVDAFNASSGGAITLTTTDVEGDFANNLFWSSLHSAQRRVDRYAANAATATTALTQKNAIGVKIAGGFGPILFEPSQLSYILRNPVEGVEVASRNFAEALLRDQLNTAVSGLVSAISGQATATFDAVAGGITYGAINSAHALFGDQSANIVANIMDGSTWHMLVGANLSNANRLFSAGNVQVVDVLGKLSVVIDSPALFTVGSPNRSRVLGLAQGAAVVSNSSDVQTNIQTVNGKERIETTVQSDYTFTLSLKGYAWDVINGGKSPTDAEIATAANWDLVATTIKHSAGVLAIGDA